MHKEMFYLCKKYKPDSTIYQNPQFKVHVFM